MGQELMHKNAPAKLLVFDDWGKKWQRHRGNAFVKFSLTATLPPEGRKPVSSGRHSFKKTDLVRALCAAKEAGLPVARVEIDPATGSSASSPRTVKLPRRPHLPRSADVKATVTKVGLGTDPEPPLEITLDAIERILAAVGEKHVPGDLDKHKLRAGLAECLATYYAALRRHSDQPIKDRLRRLKSIHRTAQQLYEQLGPEVWDWSQHSETEHLYSALGNLIFWLNSKVEDLKSEIKWGPDFFEAVSLRVDPIVYADRWKARSPFEWLAGHYLPNVFSEQFATKPTFHRHAADGIPDSPTIRFIEQALVELKITNDGQPYSRESIAKALSDARNNRVRLKTRPWRLYRGTT
jgi:hypothetical protein